MGKTSITLNSALEAIYPSNGALRANLQHIVSSGAVFSQARDSVCVHCSLLCSFASV